MHYTRKPQLEDSEIGPLLLAMEAGVKPELRTVQSYTISSSGTSCMCNYDILWRRLENKDASWKRKHCTVGHSESKIF